MIKYSVRHAHLSLRKFITFLLKHSLVFLDLNKYHWMPRYDEVWIGKHMYFSSCFILVFFPISCWHLQKIWVAKNPCHMCSTSLNYNWMVYLDEQDVFSWSGSPGKMGHESKATIWHHHIVNVRKIIGAANFSCRFFGVSYCRSALTNLHVLCSLWLVYWVDRLGAV